MTPSNPTLILKGGEPLKPKRDIYSDFYTGLDIWERGRDHHYRVAADLRARSGCSAADLRFYVEPLEDVAHFRVVFDSSRWTGLILKGEEA